MSKDSIGTRSVSEVAEKMSVSKSYVTSATNNILRKLRWPNRLKAVRKFLSEYS